MVDVVHGCIDVRMYFACANHGALEVRSDADTQCGEVIFEPQLLELACDAIRSTQPGGRNSVIKESTSGKDCLSAYLLFATSRGDIAILLHSLEHIVILVSRRMLDRDFMVVVLRWIETGEVFENRLQVEEMLMVWKIFQMTV